MKKQCCNVGFLRTVLLSVCVAAVAGGSAMVAVAMNAPTANDPAALDAILKDVVVEGKVDYAKIKSAHWGPLNAYLDGFEDRGAPEQPLADYLNLYNATMIKAVIEHREKKADWKPSDNNFGVFKEPRVKLKGGVQTLDYLENEVVRKKYTEPRVHVALCCAAVSCPPLIAEAYTTEKLEAQLEANMKRFVTDGQRNRFDDNAKAMKLSSIFDWFKADFGGAGAVPGYVGKYRAGNYAGWKVEFVPYDWTLNEK